MYILNTPRRGGGASQHKCRLTKKVGLLTVIASFVCAALVGCAIFMPLKAFAISSENDTGSIVIDEITLQGEEVAFDGSRLIKLYDALLGTNGKLSGSVEKIKQKIDSSGAKVVGSGTETLALSAKYIRDTNDNKNVYVNFGGVEWEAVYLTYNKDGEVILDLWQSAAPEKYSACTFAHGGGYTLYNNTTYSNISNIYGTSYIRAEVLNGGGVYYSYASKDLNGAGTEVTCEKSAKHIYAKFTMPTVEGSLTGFIDTPEKLEYQEKQNRCEISSGAYNFPNEAYGTLSNKNYYVNGKVNTGYGGNGTNKKVGYDVWKCDYLWLPSVTETGDGSINGLWETDKFQRAQSTSTETGDPDDGGTNTNYSWTRSGAEFNANNIYYLTSAGGAAITVANVSLAVRCALHLNLTKADAAAVISAPEKSGQEFTYSGAAQTYMPVGFDEKFMTISDNVQTDAGSYTVTVTPRYGYKFTGGLDKKTFTFDIAKAKPEVVASFGSERPFTSKGFPQPTSYTAVYMGVNITGTFDWTGQSELIEADVAKNYEWTFVPDEAYSKNYGQVKGMQEFNFKRREIAEGGLSATFDAGGKTVYTKTPLTELKEMTTLTVKYNDGETVRETAFTVAATLSEGLGNEITVMFDGNILTVPIEANVQAAAVIEIKAKLNQDGEVYTPDTPLGDIKKALTVYTIWNYTNEPQLAESGEYILSGTLTAGKPTVTVAYADNPEITAEVSPLVIKGTYDMSGVTLSGDRRVSYDGNAHGLILKGRLPSGVTLVSIVYTMGGSASTAQPVQAGEYLVTASFSGDSANYNELSPISATLTIAADYALPKVAGEKQYEREGNDFTPDGFGIIADKVELFADGHKVTAQQAFKVNGVGSYAVTVKLKDGQSKFFGGVDSVVLEFKVVKKILAVPVYRADSIRYSGIACLPEAENFVGFDSEAMQISAEKTQPEKNVGTYTAVIKLTDAEHYCWAEELTGGEAQVEWRIEKAVISADVIEGKLPTFTSGTVSRLDVITYKYYSDEACTQEVDAADLNAGTRYFVKAELKDSANFGLDKKAAQVIGVALPYDTQPEQEEGGNLMVALLCMVCVTAALLAATLTLLILKHVRDLKTVNAIYSELEVLRGKKEAQYSAADNDKDEAE